MSLKSLCVAAAGAAAILSGTNLFADTKQSTTAPKPAEKTAVKPAAAPNAAKVEAIKKMLAASGAVDANVDAARKSIKAMMKNSSNINPKFWEELTKNVNHAAFEQMLVVVNDRNYSLEEIKDLTKFYESPVGKTFREKNGKVLAESGQIMKVYMESNSKELMKKYGQPASKTDPKNN